MTSILLLGALLACSSHQAPPADPTGAPDQTTADETVGSVEGTADVPSASASSPGPREGEVIATADRAWDGRIPPGLSLPSDFLAEVPVTWHGPIGPGSATALAFAVDDSPGALHVLARGPEVQDALFVDPPSALDRIADVLFADVDGDEHLEVVVLASFVTGVGPQGMIPFDRVLVIDLLPADQVDESIEGSHLQGSGELRLVQRADVEERIGEASDRAAVVEELGLSAGEVQPAAGTDPASEGDE